MQHNQGEGEPSITDQLQQKDFALGATQWVQHMMRAKAPIGSILARLVSAAEASAAPDGTVSILLLDGDGLLRNGASPSLPVDYLKAIDGLKPDPQVGTCAAAAATGAVVVTPDFRADDKWAELRHLPLALGFLGAWSVPIKSPEGRVLGTFGTYFRAHRTPTSEERKSVELLADAAALALSDRQAP